MAPAVGQTMQIGDNYLNDGHVPLERPQIDDQSATESLWHPPQQIARASIPCHNGRIRHLAVAVFIPTPPTTHTADHPRRWAGRCGWSFAVAGADRTLMSLHAVYYFLLQNRYRRFADADSPMF